MQCVAFLVCSTLKERQLNIYVYLNNALVRETVNEGEIKKSNSERNLS